MIKNSVYNLFVFLGILIVGVSCGKTEETTPIEDDTILAQVFKKKLYASQVSQMVPESSSSADSALIANSFIDKWVRDNVLMHEAEKNIPQDLDIDELVRDYRSSLVKHNYEKLIVELQLDSVITQQELNQYYQSNKEHYLLESTILRCHFIKVPIEADGIDDLKNWWDNRSADNYKSMIEYCRNSAEVYMLEDSTWYKIEDLIYQLPKGTLTENNFNQNMNVKSSDENYQYLFRVLESVPKNKIAPLAYIREQASKVILHQRKIKLLEEQKEQMYEREMRRNNITIYTN